MGPQELCVDGYKLTEEGCEVTGLQRLIVYVSADSYSPRAAATFGAGRKLLGV
jgi:hypothetical protein